MPRSGKAGIEMDHRSGSMEMVSILVSEYEGAVPAIDLSDAPAVLTSGSSVRVPRRRHAAFR
jgi:hypothetical protein